MTKVRRLVWVDSNLLEMWQNTGVDLSTYLNKSMALFLDLPEDPNQKLLREKLENGSIRLRIQYLNELRTRSCEIEQAQSKEDTEKAKQKELIAQLTKFGEMLQQTSCFSRCLQALKTLDMESYCWDIALRELNDMNGNSYTGDQVWSNALEWYRKCPVPQS